MFGFLTNRRGDRRWDYFIRTTGVVALLGIPIVIVFPRLVTLVWLAVLGLPANGPLGPIFPTAFEPLIMEAAKHEHVLWVTLVALAVYMYMEYLNWYIYSWVLNFAFLAQLRERKWVRTSINYFRHAPFGTVVFFAITPLPFWVVRAIAILDRYPLGQFMSATAIGRFPRLFLYAWLGELLQVPAVILLAAIFGTAAAIIVYRLAHGTRLLADTAFDETD